MRFILGFLLFTVVVNFPDKFETHQVIYAEGSKSFFSLRSLLYLARNINNC